MAPHSLGRTTLLHKSVLPIVFGDQASEIIRQMVLMKAGRGKLKFPLKQIFPSVHHTMAKYVQLNLKVFTNITISANF